MQFSFYHISVVFSFFFFNSYRFLWYSKINWGLFEALYLTKTNEYEYMHFSLFMSGVSIVAVNILCWKLLCRFLYSLFWGSYFHIIFKTYYSFVPLNSSQNHYHPFSNLLYLCVISSHHQRLLFLVIKVSNKMVYYCLIPNQLFYLPLFALLCLQIKYLYLWDLLYFCFLGQKYQVGFIMIFILFVSCIISVCPFFCVVHCYWWFILF